MKIKVQAQHLKAGDIVGSGEKVIAVSSGAYTPKGKVEVRLDCRNCHWGKYTQITVERAE